MNKCIFLLLCVLILSAADFLRAESSPTLTYQIKKQFVRSNNPLCPFAYFKAENLPLHTSFHFFAEHFGSVSEIGQVYVDEEQRLINLNTKKELSLSFDTFSKGEAINCWLEDENKKILASVKVIPLPLEKRDAAGHHLLLTFITPNCEQFWLVATGFEPFEKVQMYSSSENEKHCHQVQAAADGSIHSTLAPAVIGKKTGKASVELKGKNTDHLKIHYTWGVES